MTEKPESGRLESPETLEGYLAFLPRWVGGKSERFYPVIFGPDGAACWVQHREDSPFDHAHLRPFHLRPVRVHGRVGTAGSFLVEQIVETVDPWLAPPPEPGA